MAHYQCSQLPDLLALLCPRNMREITPTPSQVARFTDRLRDLQKFDVAFEIKPTPARFPRPSFCTPSQPALMPRKGQKTCESWTPFPFWSSLLGVTSQQPQQPQTHGLQGGTTLQSCMATQYDDQPINVQDHSDSVASIHTSDFGGVSASTIANFSYDEDDEDQDSDFEIEIAFDDEDSDFEIAFDDDIFPLATQPKLAVTHCPLSPRFSDDQGTLDTTRRRDSLQPRGATQAQTLAKSLSIEKENCVGHLKKLRKGPKFAHYVIIYPFHIEYRNDGSRRWTLGSPSGDPSIDNTSDSVLSLTYLQRVDALSYWQS
eukprot:g67373.t1